MKSSIAIISILLAFLACTNSKKAVSSNRPAGKIESLSVGRAQLLQVKDAAVLVLSKAVNPNVIEQYYVLQGAKTKEIIIPSCMLSGSTEFVSLQSGNDFWVLTLSNSMRYKNFLTDKANKKILKGFGLARYSIEGVEFDKFVEELKAGKHNSQF